MTDTVFNPLAKKGLDAVRSLATLDTRYLKLDCSNDPLTGTFITRKIKPVADDTYDLGQFAPNFRWRNLALSGSFYSKAGYISGETSIIGLNITNIEEVNARARIYFTNSLGDNASIFFTSACQDVLNPCQLYIDGNGAVNFGSDNIITTGSITQDGITLDSTYLKLDATNYSSVIFPDNQYIGIDQIRARDVGGLKLYDDGGNGIFVKDGGNVGVGTDNPAELLHIKKAQVGDMTRFQVENPSDSATEDTGASFLLKADANAVGFTAWSSNSVGNIFGVNKADLVALTSWASTPPSAFLIGNGGNVPVYFTTNSALRMTILGSGFIGINETTPLAQLHINTLGSAVKGLIVKGSPSQAVNLAEYQNSAGAVLFNVASGGSVDSNVAYTTTGTAGTDRLYEINATVSSDNAAFSRYPRALFAGLTTAGATNFGSPSELFGLQGQTILSVGIESNIVSGLFGRTIINHSSSNSTEISGLTGQMQWNTTGTATNAVALQAKLFGTNITATNLYYFKGTQGTSYGINAVTNFYGLYLPDISGATTLNYAIYTNAGAVRFGDKVMFTQTDGNEAIDSLNDGYMDYLATTAHRFNAPITMASKALLETPVSGTLEYNGKFHITNNGKQKVIDRTSDVAVATVTVANTTTETTLWTGEMDANSLEVGNVFKFIADGSISSASASDTVTFRVKVGGVTKVTLVSEAKQLTDDCWHLRANSTQRTLGATGSRAMHIDLVIDDVLTELCAVGTIDTTANMDVTLTATWNNAKAGNTISLFQAFMSYKN